MLEIDNLLKDKRMTKTALAEKLGIKKQNINALLKNPTVETLQRLADALSVPIWRLFASADEIAESVESAVIRCPHCGKRFKIVPVD